MNKRHAIIITGFLVLALASVACNSSIPGTGTNTDAVTPSVAETLATLTPAASATPEEHSLPTVTLPAATAVPTSIRVSFVSSSRNLYIWTDGTAVPMQLTSSGDVDQSFISSDGSMIAFTRSVEYANYQLDVINFDGTNQRTLFSSAALAALPRPAGAVASIPYQVVWKPNTHQISMNVRIQFEGPGLQIAEQFYNIDADSGTTTILLTVPANWQFSYSPDSTKLVISRPNGLDLYNSNGTLIEPNVITHDLVNTASDYQWVAPPAWQTDSSAFAVGIPPMEPWIDSPAPSHVWKVTNTGAATNLFSTTMSIQREEIVSFDPGLTKMAYATQVGPATDNIWALHVANLDGSGDTILANGYFGQLPVWAPDGNHFLFANKTGSVSAAYLGSGSNVPVQLADVTSLMNVRWLDNSRYVVSSRNANGFSLLLGTVSSSSGVIFNDAGSSSEQSLTFDINR